MVLTSSLIFATVGIGAGLLAVGPVTTKIEIGANLTTVCVSGFNLAAALLNAFALRKRASTALDAKQFQGQSPRKPRAIQRGKQPSPSK